MAFETQSLAQSKNYVKKTQGWWRDAAAVSRTF
jgi:hypothetical protein